MKFLVQYNIEKKLYRKNVRERDKKKGAKNNIIKSVYSTINKEERTTL